MEVAPHQVIPVVEASQPSAVRYAVRARAARIGFSESDSYRAGLGATELATNLVKHAHGGEVLLRTAAGDDAALEILAIDKGPGIANVAMSLADGQSTAGTTGIGLGAAARMSDEFDVYSSMPNGTVVLARLRGKGAAAPKRQPPLAIGGISVAKAGETECGDAWAVTPSAEGCATLVADGLGHGHFAAEAAAAAIGIAASTGHRGCANTLAAVHDGIRHTRGVAAAIAEIAVARRTVIFAGVGNIGAAIVDNGSTRQAVSHNGILGHEARLFREYTYPWPQGALLVMYSDGLISHWSVADYRGLRRHDPAVIAAVLYRDFSRGRDDVTVVVVREAT